MVLWQGWSSVDVEGWSCGKDGQVLRQKDGRVIRQEDRQSLKQEDSHLLSCVGSCIEGISFKLKVKRRNGKKKKRMSKE